MCKDCADHLKDTEGLCPYKEFDKDDVVHYKCEVLVEDILQVKVPKNYMSDDIMLVVLYIYIIHMYILST